MTLLDLRTALRERLDDEGSNTLFSDSELNRYINNAVEMAQRYRFPVYDDSSSFCEITLVSNQTQYAIDNRIFLIISAQIDGCNKPLLPLPSQEFWQNIKWTDTTGGTQYFLFSNAKIILAPAPLLAGTMQLKTYRISLTSLTDNIDVPEIPEQYHRFIVHGAAWEASSKAGIETYEPEFSTNELAIYTQAFGNEEISA